MSDTRESGIEDGNPENPFGIRGVKVVDPATDSGDAAPTGTGEGGGESPTGGEPAAPIAKKRGRKPGSKNSTKKASGAADLSGLETLLYAVHIALATATKSPELALDPAEAAKLAEAAALVQAQYDVALSPKMIAWSQLVITAGAVYGPRVIAISIRKKNEKMARRKNTVVSGDFPNHAST